MIKRSLRRLALLLMALSDRQPPPPPPRASKGAFERRAQTLLAAQRQHSQTATAGSIQLVGLDDVKRAVGPAWPEIAGRARVIAESVIRRHLTDADVYTEQDNGTFVLFFADKDKTRAAQKARLISEEMKAAITQQIPKIAHSVRVDHFVAEIDSDIVFEDERPLADALFDSLSRIRREAEEAVQKRRAALIRGAGVVFRPVWHAGKRAALLFRCMIDAPSGSIAMEHFAAISEPDQLQGAIAELDFLVLGKAISALHQLLQKEAKAVLLIPVNFHTTANKSSMDDYLRLCQGLPDPYKKFIFFEIHGAPVGTPASRIAQLSAALQPFCHGVVVENAGKHQDINNLAGTRVWGVSLDISDALVSSSELLAVMKRTVTIARAQNLVAIMHGANSMGQLQAAIETGFDYIDGEAVHVSMNEPKGAFKFTPLALSSALPLRHVS